MVINHLLTGMILQVVFQTSGEKVSFGPQEHTDQTPNIQTIPEVFGRLGFGSKHGIKSFAAAFFSCCSCLFPYYSVPFENKQPLLAKNVSPKSSNPVALK